MTEPFLRQQFRKRFAAGFPHHMTGPRHGKRQVSGQIRRRDPTVEVFRNERTDLLFLRGMAGDRRFEPFRFAQQPLGKNRQQTVQRRDPLPFRFFHGTLPQTRKEREHMLSVTENRHRNFDISLAAMVDPAASPRPFRFGVEPEHAMGNAILPVGLPAGRIRPPVRGAVLPEHRRPVRTGQHMMAVVQGKPAAAQLLKAAQYWLKFKHISHILLKISSFRQYTSIFL